MAIRNIIVPTDFSPDADRALELALEFARSFGAKLHLVHSCYLGPYLAGFREPVGIPIEFAQNVRAEASLRLEALGKRASERGVASEAHLAAADPVSAVLELARSVDADLIVMGTRGLTGLKHAFAGSVAERTVRLAPCPVLTVKADASSMPGTAVQR